MKTLYVINRDDIREYGKIAEIELPDLVDTILDRCCWLSSDELDELYDIAESANTAEFYTILERLEYAVFNNKMDLLDFIDQNR